LKTDLTYKYRPIRQHDKRLDIKPSTYYVDINFFHNRIPICSITTKFKLYVMLKKQPSVLSEHKND